jgi:predicted ATP-grasp superfamily ATP-dependent carboligase
MKNTTLQSINSLKNKPGVVVIEGHVQGLANTRLLGQSGIPVIVIDKDDCVAKYSKYCKAFYKCPDYLSEDFIDFLIRLDKAFNLTNWLLLPSNDHAVYNISLHKDTLSRYYKIITEDIEIIENIYNKRKLLQIADKAGIPIPATIMPELENPRLVDLRYPILIKGNQGLNFYKRFKHKAFIITTPEKLINIWGKELKEAKPEEYIIQEIIPNVHKTVSVTVFAEKGTVYTYWMGVKLREHPVTFGTATCAKSIYDEEMLKLSKQLIKELNYSGVCEIEWLRDSRDNIPKLIEINARTWLWVGLAAKCGVNYPKIIYEYMYDRKIPKVTDYLKDKIWLNIYTDFVYSMLNIFKKLESPGYILKTYSNFQEACWDIKDPIPFIKYGLMINNFIKCR